MIFFIALLLLCFTISNTATIISVSIMSALVVSLVIWCIRTSWESTEGEDVWRDSLVVFKRARGNLLERVMEFNPFRTRRFPRDISQDDHITLTDRVGRV